MSIEVEATGPQARWDSTFSKLGRSAPAQRADEGSFDYMRRLAREGRKYIPESEEVQRIHFDRSLPDGVVEKFSEMVRERVEANLYRVDNMQPGEMRSVVEHDEATGRQIRNWVGPQSFVVAMGRPGRRVVRINAPAQQTLYQAGPRPGHMMGF